MSRNSGRLTTAKATIKIKEEMKETEKKGVVEETGGMGEEVGKEEKEENLHH